MIRLEHVTKRFGDTLALDDLSLQVDGGEVCVLIGPSGCGKTTTLRLINRMVEPTSGEVRIDGRDVRHFRPEQLRRRIGYAIQSVGLFPHMTVAQNIAVVPRLLGWEHNAVARRTRHLVALVGLDPVDYLDKYPSQLSGGEAQRVGVARALAADPPVLLMDEPFGAVDPRTRQRLQDQFMDIQQELKKTVVLVTHDLDEAIRMADRIAIMRSGRLVQHDRPEVILSRPASKFVYDFVGTDRALKRLSRMSVGPFVRPALVVQLNASRQEAQGAMGKRRSAWVVAENGVLAGWVNSSMLQQARSVAQAAFLSDPREIAISPANTLREALSRMLGQGFKAMPVVDHGFRLLGEIELHDVEAATIQAEDWGASPPD